MVRNDAIMGPGKLTYSKISNIIDSPLIVKQLRGSTILKMLELSVSSYPNYTGQFLFVSGLTFSFDYLKEPRVQEVKIGGKNLDIHNHYTLCTSLYQARGGDGFIMLK
jgi:2',3'-cyclic-nucleotide 2'-phosphodiesterase (5'-nucleotidase family)